MFLIFWYVLDKIKCTNNFTERIYYIVLFMIKIVFKTQTLENGPNFLISVPRKIIS